MKNNRFSQVRFFRPANGINCAEFFRSAEFSESESESESETETESDFESVEHPDEIGGAKSYCAHGANYRDNRQMMFNRAFACIVIRDKQVGASPIEPAHVIKEECAYEPEKKNKNNDCKDFIQYGSCK